MKVWYDTEFFEMGRGHSIDMISIGAVREDDEEFYAISDSLHTILRANKNKWMRDNVLPYLPLRQNFMGHLVWDEDHPDFKYVKSIEEIAQAWKEYVLVPPRFPFDRPELWAYYGAYDHVVMAQMYGKMINLPKGMPMYTMDIQQRWHNEGKPELPKQIDGEHKAIDDARWNRIAYEYIDNRNE
jgi:hypothetical protein